MNRTSEPHLHGGRLIGTSYIRSFPLRLAEVASIGPDSQAVSCGNSRFPMEPPLSSAPSRWIVRWDRPVVGRSGIMDWVRSRLHGRGSMI